MKLKELALSHTVSKAAKTLGVPLREGLPVGFVPQG